MQTPDHPRESVLLSALILLPAAFCFAAMADLPHALVITLVLLGFSGLRRQGWPLSDRGLIYTVVTAAVLTTFSNYLVPLKMERFNFMALFSRPGLTVPFLLYLGALAPGFRRRSLAVGAAGAAALFAFTIGCDVRFERLQPERMQFLLFFPVNFKLLYALTATLSGTGILFGSRLCGAGRTRQPAGRVHIVLLLAAFIGILLLTAAEFRLYHRYEDTLRNWENRLLRLGVRRFYRGGQPGILRFGSTPNLNIGFPPHASRFERQVVLRAVGTAPPGYLRTATFGSYHGGRWIQPPELERQDTMEAAANAPGTFFADQLYKVSRLEPAENAWTFYLDSRVRSEKLPIPGHTVSLRFIAEQAAIAEDGSIELTGLAREGGYTAYADTPSGIEAYPLPDPPPEEYSRLPENLVPELEKIVRQLDLKNLPDDSSRFARVLAFFRDNFEYALDWPGTPHGDDPVQYFLTTRRRAHCELFASGLALLLRAAGIPTRYVTGLVCFERHPSSRYYLARVANSHAWVEAFDRNRKTWVLLDATPASVNVSPPLPDDNWRNALDSQIDSLALFWAELIANLRSGRVANAIMILLIGTGRLFGAIFLTPVGGILLAAALVFGIHLELRRLRRRRADADRRKVQAEFLRLCRRLRHEKLLARGTEPTAAELIRQIEEMPELPPERRRKLLEFLYDYLVRRYRPRRS